MGYNNYRNYGNAVTDYRAKCALAEKLGDVKLRQWCVERLGVAINGMDLDFSNVNALFDYIKGKEDNT